MGKFRMPHFSVLRGVTPLVTSAPAKEGMKEGRKGHSFPERGYLEAKVGEHKGEQKYRVQKLLVEGKFKFQQCHNLQDNLSRASEAFGSLE